MQFMCVTDEWIEGQANRIATSYHTSITLAEIINIEIINTEIINSVLI